LFPSNSTEQSITTVYLESTKWSTLSKESMDFFVGSSCSCSTLPYQAHCLGRQLYIITSLWRQQQTPQHWSVLGSFSYSIAGVPMLHRCFITSRSTRTDTPKLELAFL
jgi:hypothetical protein